MMIKDRTTTSLTFDVKKAYAYVHKAIKGD